MSFSSMVEADSDTIFNTSEHAEEVYLNGAATSIPAIVDYGDSRVDEDQNNRNFRCRKAEISIKTSDYPTISYRDTFLIGTTTWYVRKEIHQDAYDTVLGIETEEKPRLS